MNGAIRLRLAALTDVAQLVAIELRSFSDPWSASAFRDVLKMPGATIIAATIDDDASIVGFCILMVAADQGEIANLAVATNTRRAGVGRALLREALLVARHKAVVAVFLEVRASNAAARALYASHGFSEIGRRRGYYQRPTEDALVLQWSATGAIQTMME